MKKTSLLALPFAIGLLIALPGAAQADPGPGNFGQHVSACLQTMQFGADMNPGMHQGNSDGHEMSC